jgi:hypothetical protein
MLWFKIWSSKKKNKTIKAHKKIIFNWKIIIKAKKKSIIKLK